MLVINIKFDIMDISKTLIRSDQTSYKLSLMGEHEIKSFSLRLVALTYENGFLFFRSY